MAVAMVDPTLQAMAITATPQVAASTIITAILTPMLTLYLAKRNRKKKLAAREKEIYTVNTT